MAKAILVVGSEGFVGVRLVSALRAAGKTVLTASRRAQSPREKLDINDRAAVHAFIERERPTAIVHLAGVATSPGVLGGNDAHFSVNHIGFRNVYDAAAAAGCKRVVLASSTSVYGNPEHTRPVTERDELAPDSAYARSKVVAESVCANAPTGAPAAIVLRFPPVYAGDWIRNLRVRAYVPGLGKRALLSIRGADPLFSLCAIENAVEALRLAADGALAAGIYNVADARPYPQSEIRRVVGALDNVRRSVALPASVVRRAGGAARFLVPGKLGRSIRSNIDKLVGGLVIDTSKIVSAGFAPRRALSDLVAATP